MKRILIVDDDKRIAMALSVRLRASGFEIGNAYDAMMAVTAARKEPPDLVLLDLMMPAGGGLKVAERLRGMSETATTPIIILTAAKDPEMREQATGFQPFAIFDKPYDPLELLQSIHGALAVTT